jgi:hypothetical protein
MKVVVELSTTTTAALLTLGIKKVLFNVESALIKEQFTAKENCINRMGLC